MSDKLSEEVARKKAEDIFRDLIRMAESFETTMAKISTAMLNQDMPGVLKNINELKEKVENEQDPNRTIK
jgi:hypothetical protein